MDEGVFIPGQQVFHLDTPASRHKRRRQDFESNVITENQSEIFGDSLVCLNHKLKTTSH